MDNSQFQNRSSSQPGLLDGKGPSALLLPPGPRESAFGVLLLETSALGRTLALPAHLN